MTKFDHLSSGFEEMTFHVMNSQERSVKHHKITPCGVPGKTIVINNGFVRGFNIIQNAQNFTFQYELWVKNL